MITVEKAQELLLETFVETQLIPLEKSLGLYLAEDIYADRDFPPFHRVAMDGIAINLKNLRQLRFEIQGTQGAGQPPLMLEEGKCIEVMTGAVLPQNADLVIPYENLEKINNSFAVVQCDNANSFSNIHRKGCDSSEGTKLISKYSKITASMIAVIASIGKRNVSVYCPSAIAIVSTGDELVNIEDQPLFYQIRKSNIHAIGAVLSKIFPIRIEYFHFNDEKIHLQQGVNKIFANYKNIIFSGAVSKGKYDYLPEVLKELGIEIKFHGVNQKPGKPFLFGVNENHKVFGLPGNPQSSLICFYRYILPHLFGNQFNFSSVHISNVDQDKKRTIFKWSEDSSDFVNSSGSGDMISQLSARSLIEVPPVQIKTNVFKRIPMELV